MPQGPRDALMDRRRVAWIAGAAACCGLFAFAFVAAPASCEWGLEAYAGAGLACVVALAVLPFALRAGPTVAARAGLAALLVAAVAAACFAGLFAANVRILCRLF
jgi:hypothetical protein